MKTKLPFCFHHFTVIFLINKIHGTTSFDASDNISDNKEIRRRSFDVEELSVGRLLMTVLFKSLRSLLSQCFLSAHGRGY